MDEPSTQDDRRPLVSVVICAYTTQRWADLVAAVESCRQQSYERLEIVLVIDHNPVLYARCLERWTTITIVESHRTRGLSGARNAGIDVAEGDIVAFLDDDAVASSHWLTEIVESLATTDASGAGGPIVPLWSGSAPMWFPPEFAWVVGCTHPDYGRSSMRNLFGANMAFRRSAFSSTRFREEWGQVGTSMHRCDETDFSIRLRQAKGSLTLAFNPRATVDHRVPASRSTIRYFATRCFTEGEAKRRLTREYGAAEVLGPERAFARSTVPKAVLRSCSEACRRRSSASLGRATVTVFGLALTTLGYVVEPLRSYSTDASAKIRGHCRPGRRARIAS